MKKQNDTNFNLINYIRNNSLTIALQVVGFLVVVANLWLASKLAPLTQNLDNLTEKVDAMQTQVQTDSTQINHIDVIDANIDQIRASIKDIKDSQDKLFDLIIKP